MYPLAELLGEDGHFLITPETIPLKVTIIGAETWVEYGKCQKVDTQKLFAALSKG